MCSMIWSLRVTLRVSLPLEPCDATFVVAKFGVWFTLFSIMLVAMRTLANTLSRLLEVFDYLVSPPPTF